MNQLNDVGQPFLAAGSGRFPAPRSSSNARETGKSPQPAASKGCPTSKPDQLLSGFHSRDHLPHLKREGGTYFVTFREAGSLPKDVLLKFKHEREQILSLALAANRPLTWHEQEQLFRWYSERVDHYLDAGHGECRLKDSAIADIVACALRFHENIRFNLLAWVVMPNHVHAVIRPRPSRNLSRILQSWKGYTGHEANRLLRRASQPFWQSESYDHLTRDDDDLYRYCHYTTSNPVNAGLCAHPEDWKWSSLYNP
jgi:REP element-mobilizing transposase RayT